mgnify:CR=1 FL=1
MKGYKTIPIHPTYSINKDLIVRNDKTNEVIKPIINNNVKYYSLQKNGKRVKAKAIDLYICAFRRFDLLEKVSKEILSNKRFELKPYYESHLH